MTRSRWGTTAGSATVWLAALAVLAMGMGRAGAEDVTPIPDDKAKGRYQGAKKCKNCHSAKATGNQYAKWLDAGHAKAHKVLGTAKAKEAGKKRGVDNPQTSAKCLKCHVTGFGLPKARFDRKFDPKLGVQCETCHGPGEKHVKARFAAAEDAEDDGDGFGFDEDDDEDAEPVKIPKSEIVARPDLANLCIKCHNKASPGFEGFCVAERLKKIRHLNPKKKKAKHAVLECGCKPCKCTKDECGCLTKACKSH
jgi:hypothetical protein